MSNKFKITLPILKTSTEIVTRKGKEMEERFVEGIASNTDIDLQMDRISEDGIESMRDSLRRHVIKMNDSHDQGWSSEISDDIDLFIDDKSQLHVKARLNGMSRADDLWHALNEANKKLGLSIGGMVKDYDFETIENEKEDEEEYEIRVIHEIDLDHIAVTSSPANPKTWIDTISKSLKEDDTDIILDKETMKKKKDTSLEATAEKTVSTSDDVAAPENEVKEDVVEEPKADKPKEEEDAPAEESAPAEEEEVAEESTEEKPAKEPAEESTEKETSDPEEKEEVAKEEEAEEESSDEDAEEEDAPAEKPKDEEPKEPVSKKEPVEEKEKEEKVEKDKEVEKEDEVVKSVLVAMKALAGSLQDIEKRLSKLEDEPAERVSAEAATKSIGNGDDAFNGDELTNKQIEKLMSEEIEAIEKDTTNPNRFSDKQKVRAKYESMKD
jgi:hypothetical protein